MKLIKSFQTMIVMETVKFGFEFPLDELLSDLARSQPGS